MNMRKLVIAAALASTIGAAPALGRDNSPYVGIEGGVLRAQDTDIDYEDVDDDVANAIRVEHNRGVDLDLVAGYDFGAVRVEGELGYKRASIEELRIDTTILDVGDGLDVDGKTRVVSGMLNGLLDFGRDDGVAGYVGGGVGIARLKMRADLDDVVGGFSGRDRGIAWQAIAGLRVPISQNVDAGLKYRFFSTKFDFEDDDAVLGNRELDGKFRSHSLLASLIFNFGAPAAPPPPLPPPPPPPTPAPPTTQTCPDGSVILATDSCPLPPPPPPPPPPAPERG